MYYFQDIVAALSAFWAKNGCLVVTPYDLEKGASTSNPTTLLRALGPEPFSAALIEPCRRPKDGRYGLNPNRLQHYFQYQVILKPSPDNIVDLYLASLEAIGLKTCEHDIRFVHDDWENPTLGAWGLGWEVWIDGMEDTQFTFFQAAAGIPLKPVTGEITYGIERLTMCLQGVHSIFDIKWNENITYGDLYLQNEIQWSQYNFELQDDAMWMRHFEDYQKEANRLVAANLPIPAYDFVLKASHAFNMLDAKGCISVSERAGYMAKVRDLTKTVADSYVGFREKLHFPLLKSVHTEKSPNILPPPKNIDKTTDRYVLEIGVEALPAAFVPIGIEGLKRALTLFLEKEHLPYSSLQTFGTPRRLTAIINDLSSHTDAISSEKRGPCLKVAFDEYGKLSQTGLGFLKGISQGPCSKEELVSGAVPGLFIRPVKGEPYIFATIVQPPQPTATILQEQLPLIIKSLEFPKMMHWGDHTLSFARPIRWILSLFGSSPVPFMLEHITADRITYGHRQRKNEKIVVSHAKDYEELLRNAFVIVDQKLRKETILAGLRQAESDYNLRGLLSNRLLEELTYLCELPEVASATFNQALLDAPKEILSSEMIEHQKYIPLTDVHGSLSNRFLLVADNTPTERVKEGNVKVLTARLSDGSFLWKEDRKVPLEILREKLHTVIYQKSLGTVFEKTARLAQLVEKLHAAFPTANLSLTKTAAQLSKADLVSHVVGEFPHLQGLIGSYLAKEQDLPEEACRAISEQYLPDHEEGPLPSSPGSSLLAIADKLDTLAGFFAIDLKPSSSNDPYALRRQAIGIVKIFLNEKVHLHLSAAIEQALLLYQEKIRVEKTTDVICDIQSYIATRAKAIFCEMGFSKESVEAIVSSQNDDLYDAFLRLYVLKTVHQSEHFAHFLEVLKRSLGQAETITDTRVDEALLSEDPEKDLYQAILSAEKSCSLALQSHNWDAYISALLELRQSIGNLFDHVRVLADDAQIRRNRLALLARIIRLASLFANPKKLVETIQSKSTP